jgi:glycosyltransferase involved in cell wall biosynthesis
VVPNPIRPIFCADIAVGAPPGRVPLVAWIGRLDAMKNWPEFVAIAGRLRSLGVAAEFRLVGRPVRAETGGELLGRLEAEGVAECLRWYRGLDHARVPMFLDCVRDSGGVVVVTSRGESFGMVAAEAMARGCACVLADQPPLSELAFAGRTALTYPPGDIAAAARQVQALLSDERERALLGGRAREEILARHAPAAAVPALAQTLRSIVESRAPR